MARYAHVTDFRVVADCFSCSDLCKLLGITKSTLNRWLAGKSKVPWIAYQILYDRSKYGLAERDSIEHFERRAILGQRDSLLEQVSALESEISRLTSLIDWGCANDPTFILKQA